jgi:hypothetical protein
MGFDHLMQLWKQPWTHWVVFGAAWLIAYLVVSAVLYAQYAIWVRGKYPWVVYVLVVISILAGVTFGLVVLTGINAVFTWYTKPWGPPLPTALVLDYQPFWGWTFAVALVIATTPLYGVWYELRRWRKANEIKPMSYPDDDLYDKAVRP